MESKDLSSDETARILGILEASPAIQAVRAYLELNPMPKWEVPPLPEQEPFPPFPDVSEYKYIQEENAEQAKEWQEGAVHAWWGCKSWGAKAIARESKTVWHDEGEDSGYAHTKVEHQAPVGWDIPRLGKTPTQSKGATPPQDCCYHKFVKEYEKACPMVRERNANARKLREKACDEKQKQYAEKVEAWTEAAPPSIKFLFPSGVDKYSDKKYIAKWLTGERYGIERDKIFQERVPNELAELEKL